MNLLSNISSIATMLLFIIYFIGRIWTIKKEKHFATETFHVTSSETAGEHDDAFDFMGMATVEVISSIAYKYVEVIPIEYGDDINEPKKIRYKAIRKENVQANKPIYIVVDLPETLPHHIVEFQRYDGIKGSFYILDSGKTGEIVPGEYTLKHTLSSILYYLFR